MESKAIGCWVLGNPTEVPGKSHVLARFLSRLTPWASVQYQCDFGRTLCEVAITGHEVTVAESLTEIRGILSGT